MPRHDTVRCTCGKMARLVGWAAWWCDFCEAPALASDRETQDETTDDTTDILTPAEAR